jgi:phage terminase large subunit
MRDQFTNHKHGLDFGYSSDPAALWISHYDKAHKTIYLYDELYEVGLTNDVLSEFVKEKIGKTKRVRTYDDVGKPIDNYVPDGTQPVTCDSAEPKSIAELRSFGVSARSARKGKDSVLYGIQWLQQQTIIVDTRCINARNELMTYQWKEDAGGNALPIPMDKNNHLIDAGRYAYEDEALNPEIEIQDLNI